MRKELRTTLNGTRSEIVSRIWRYVRARTPEARKRVVADHRADYLGRMDPRTAAVYVRTEDEALDLGAEFMDTGHLLAGLLALEDDPASNLLREHGLSIEALRPRLSRGFSDSDIAALATIGVSLQDVIERAEASLGKDALRKTAQPAQIWRLPQSWELMMAMSGAVMEADTRDAQNVYPIHIFASIVEPPSPVRSSRAIGLLVSSGCDLGDIRERIRREIGPRTLERAAQRGFFDGRGALGAVFRFGRAVSERQGRTERA